SVASGGRHEWGPEISASSDAPDTGRHRRTGAYRDVWSVLRAGGKVAAASISFALLLISGWAWYNYADLKRHTHVLNISGLGAPTPVGATGSRQIDGTAQNILIVGIDSRAGLTAAQKRYLKVGNDITTSTDTIMLVHVPADGSKATLISIPRDSWVH